MPAAVPEIALRSPTPVFVAVSSAGSPFGGEEELARAFDDFFTAFARRYPHTDAVLVVTGDGDAESIAATCALARGFSAVRIAFGSESEPGSREAFVEKHCPIVLTGAARVPHRSSTKQIAHAPFRFRIDASRAEARILTGGDPALAVLDDVDDWNADAAGTIAFDGSLCAKTFECADAMAVRAQEQTHHAVDRVFWFTVCSGLSLQVYDHLGDFMPQWGSAAVPFGLVFVAFILAAVLTVRRIRAAEVQRDFQDRRALAEGLRVQQALLEAGIDVALADRYPAELDEGIEWIRRAIDAAYLGSCIASGRTFDRDVEPMLNEPPAWIAEQRAYYARASAGHRACGDVANRVAVSWLRLSIVAASLVAVDALTRLATHFGIVHYLAGTDRYTKPALLTTLAIAGSLAALTKGKAAVRGHRVLAERYDAMHGLFADAAHALDASHAAASSDGRHEATQIIVRLAEKTLAENAEWHASMRSRPLQSIWSS